MCGPDRWVFLDLLDCRDHVPWVRVVVATFVVVRLFFGIWSLLYLTYILDGPVQVPRGQRRVPNFLHYEVVETAHPWGFCFR